MRGSLVLCIRSPIPLRAGLPNAVTQMPYWGRLCCWPPDVTAEGLSCSRISPILAQAHKDGERWTVRLDGFPPLNAATSLHAPFWVIQVIIADWQKMLQVGCPVISTVLETKSKRV